MREHALDRLLADEAGRPLDHAVGHAMILAHGTATGTSGTATTTRPAARLAQRLARRAAAASRDALDAAPAWSDPGRQHVRGRRPRPARRARRPPAARPTSRGRLVELDPELAATAAAHAPPGVEVVVRRRGDDERRTRARCRPTSCSCAASSATSPTTTSHNTVRALPTLCAPGATVIWTRHRRPPDLTADVRRGSPKRRSRRSPSPAPTTSCSASVPIASRGHHSRSSPT